MTGRSKVITALPDKLAFDKLETQGLPFYGGNVTYHLEVEANGALSVTATNYYGALIGVSVDGADNGRIIYPPYTLLAEDIGSGTHKVDITLYGHRFNAFGAVHLTDNRHSCTALTLGAPRAAAGAMNTPAPRRHNRLTRH